MNHYLKNTPIYFLIIFLTSCSLEHTSKKAEKLNKQQPNIVLFLVDDMGLMDLSVPMLAQENGQPKSYPLNQFYHTPNLENLAENGIRFSQFYAHSVCSPTRSSIFTGQNSARHKTTQWINQDKNNKGDFGPSDWNWAGLSKDQAVLLNMLNGRNYETIHIGKGHFAPVSAAGSDPIELGFDINIGGAAHGAPGSYLGQEAYGKYKGKGVVPHLEQYHDTDTFLTEALTLEANKAISHAVQNDKPFFLYLSHYAVHTPFYADPRFIHKYQDTDKTEAAKVYASMVEGIDKSIGDVVRHLETLEVAENTLVLFLGDNGSTAPLAQNKGARFSPYSHSSSAPLRGMKGTSYEGGMRVPFIAAWAKSDLENDWQRRMPIAKGYINTQMGSILDLVPTIQYLIDGSISDSHTLDGENLALQLAGQKNTERSETFLNHFPHVHRSSYYTSYVEGNWKLVYYYPLYEDFKVHDPNRKKPEVGYRLFNLKDDPFEKNNLAGTHKSDLKRMLKAMQSDLENKGALYPVKQGRSLKPALP